MEISVLKGTKCRSFDNSPTVLLIFKRTVSMWLFQESLWSIRTPKYLKNSLHSNCLCLLVLGLYIYNLGVKGSFFWYGRKITKRFWQLRRTFQDGKLQKLIANIRNYVAAYKNLFRIVHEDVVNKCCWVLSHSSWLVNCWNEIAALKAH